MQSGMPKNNGYPTIRGQVRDEIDEIIKMSYTMDIFLENAQKARL